MVKEMLRQGGRSARIQVAVHSAVEELAVEVGREGLAVPLIAERAGVTPSTIYRRWGDLAELLADVAVQRLRPVSDPDDTGALASDLEAFVLQYAEEMSSKVGRSLLLDVLAASGNDPGPAGRCCQYTSQHLETIRARAIAREEDVFEVDIVIDVVIAPIVYHILFGDREPDAAYCRALLARL
ncbi:AcrR family transcriptional regulator [Pararhizobium capsulatum DSM 1112]|uniref:AcrR family transcriptional regulator n=1 Tax=Pararhizobium capsulatum DSM 1112 TaxID=1121113 RepID=A0ABU0BPP1_9HYPH|nr:TetR/AcrR family transcriptional regulator [Pararhizobium capsulatum]MDQ0320220.1 AcrR family transcriptional regulator [Pararhizobium capsulatum DSM 1112]